MPLSSVILSWTSFEFSRCRLCARLASCERSHSQDVDASGRPKIARKYVLALKLLSGNCIARVPGGNPSNLFSDFVTTLTASNNASAVNRRG